MHHTHTSKLQAGACNCALHTMLMAKTSTVFISVAIRGLLPGSCNVLAHHDAFVLPIYASFVTYRNVPPCLLLITSGQKSLPGDACCRWRLPNAWSFTAHASAVPPFHPGLLDTPTYRPHVHFPRCGPACSRSLRAA